MAAADQPDFSEAYRRYADAVYRFCLSQLRDPAAAEDVTADVFASAFAARGTLLPGSDGFRPWLFRIARNATIDQRRRARTRFRLLGALRAEQPKPADVESAVVLREDLRSVLDAIGQLRPRDRTLVGLRVAGGLSYAQIGQVLGMKENAARMGVQRAIQRIRAAAVDAHE